jgi:predicted outer membrane lipoprotein
MILLGGLLYVAFSITDCMSVEWQDDRKIRKDFEGSGRGLIKVLSRYLPAGCQVSVRRFQRRASAPEHKSVTSLINY